MVRKVVLFLVLPTMFIALFLSMVGVHQIGYGDTYRNFLANVSHTYDSFSFEIPSIPKISKLIEGDYDRKGAILQVLINIANFFVNLVNGLITILNILIMVLNVLIQLVQFVVAFVLNIKDFINSMRTSIVFA